MKNLIDDLNYIRANTCSFRKTLSDYENTFMPDLSERITKTEKILQDISGAREYYRKAIDLIYEKSLGQLKETLNLALQYIFYDKDYSIELNLEDKRGKSLQLMLKDSDGNEISLKDGIGMGVRTVVSAVLQIYYLNAKHSNILLVDEKYSYISESYIQRFFEFLGNLCKSLNFKVVIISHDVRFFDYADKVITVNDGQIRYAK